MCVSETPYLRALLASATAGPYVCFDPVLNNGGDVDLYPNLVPLNPNSKLESCNVKLENYFFSMVQDSQDAMQGRWLGWHLRMRGGD